MQREYLILMQGDKSCGAVKIEQSAEGLTAEINVEQSVGIENDTVLKAYLTLPNKDEVRYLGVLDGYKAEFTVKNTSAPLGIVITRKNTKNGKEEMCCVCAEQGKLTEMKQCFEGKEKPAISQNEKKEVNLEKEYIKTSEARLYELFPECEFEKVNGYFLRESSRIAQFIMSGKDVYRRIAEWGYYYFAHKGENEFVIAVPSHSDETSPFEGCEEYSFKTGCGLLEDGTHYCIVAGCDENGEYFCRKN